MSDFFKFATENPWLTFFLAIIVAGTASEIVSHITSIFKKRRDTNAS